MSPVFFWCFVRTDGMVFWSGVCIRRMRTAWCREQSGSLGVGTQETPLLQVIRTPAAAKTGTLGTNVVLCSDSCHLHIIAFVLAALASFFYDYTKSWVMLKTLSYVLRWRNKKCLLLLVLIQKLSCHFQHQPLALTGLSVCFLVQMSGWHCCDCVVGPQQLIQTARKRLSR